MVQRRGWGIRSAVIGTVTLVAALALVGAWQGHASAIMALSGSMAVLYARGAPYLDRARTVLIMGLLIVALATAASLAAGSHAGLLAVLVVGAVVASLATQVLRVSIPGPTLLLVPATIVCSIPPAGSAGITHRIAMVALGAGAALVVALSPALGSRERAERRALAVSFGAVAAALLALDTTRFHPARNAAWAALDSAHRALSFGESLPGHRNQSAPTLWMLFDHATAVMARAEVIHDGGSDPTAGNAAQLLLGVAARLRSRDRLHSLGTASGPVVAPSLEQEAQAALAALDAVPPIGSANGSRPQYPRRRLSSTDAHYTMTAIVRIGTVVLLSGSAAIALGMGRWYWAPVSAVATMWGTHYRVTWHRAVQRAVATLVGCSVGLLLVHLPVNFAGSVTLVAVLFFAADLYFPRNYGFALASVSAMVLVLIQAGSPVPINTWALADDRVAAAAVGAVFGLAAVLLLWPQSSTRQLTHRLEVSRQLQSRIRGELTDTKTDESRASAIRHELRQDLVTLEESADAALGERRRRAEPLWTAAAGTQRAGYLLLSQIGS